MSVRVLEMCEHNREIVIFTATHSSKTDSVQDRGQKLLHSFVGLKVAVFK